MMRNLPVVSILVLSACSRNALPKRVQDESWKQDFITCTNEATEGVPAEPEANNILLRSARAYDALQSYAGSINVESTADYEARVFSETRRLKVFFQKPSKIRLEALDPEHAKFVILSDGQTTRVFGLGSDARRGAVQDAMFEFSGVSLHATVMLPSFLLGTKWNRDNFFLPYGPLLSAFATEAQLAGEECIREHRCYRIVCNRRIATWTFWVDKETLLIRRLEETASEEQMRVQQELGGGGWSRRILSTRSAQSFENEQIDVKLDDDIFSRR